MSVQIGFEDCGSASCIAQPVSSFVTPSLQTTLGYAG